MISPRFTKSAVIAVTFAMGTSLLGATVSGASGTTTTTTTTPTTITSIPTGSGPTGRPTHPGGSNARSGPQEGGSVGKVSSVSTTGFSVLTSAGEKVTIKVTANTTFQMRGHAVSALAITKGKTILALGVANSATITAKQVFVEPANSAFTAKSKDVPFQQGAPSVAKKVGQIPANYKEGMGTIVTGTTADKATTAALAAYPGGTVDRVVQISPTEYEVHNIGVNWPHHIFINQNFKVVGAY
jgi:hypothetical protein